MTARAISVAKSKTKLSPNGCQLVWLDDEFAVWPLMSSTFQKSQGLSVSWPQGHSLAGIATPLRIRAASVWLSFTPPRKHRVFLLLPFQSLRKFVIPSSLALEFVPHVKSHRRRVGVPCRNTTAKSRGPIGPSFTYSTTNS